MEIVANYLGLTEQVAKLGGQMNDCFYIDGLNGEVMTQFSLAQLIEEVGQRPYPTHRLCLNYTKYVNG